MIDKLQHIADRIIQRYFVPVSLTLLIHLIFFGILIVLEMSKPDLPFETPIIVEFPDEIEEEQLQSLLQKQQNGEENNDELKNVEKNLADKNQSDKDYYREAKELLKSAQEKEVFKANDYKDLRWLVKDYSSEIPDVENWNKPENENSQNQQEKQSTYSGNAIVSYDLGGRKATRLPIPAYKCMGQGKVTIEISVNPKGQVISAKISEASASISETCLPQSALDAAYRSRFQPNDKAPSLQRGFIDYTFVAQK